MSTSKTPRERYNEKLMPGLADRPGCIGWRAKIDKYGNASFTYTAEDGRKVSVNAARWAWEAFRGPLPADHKVSNTCGLKSCQNLGHWELKPTNRGKSLWELYELKFTKGGPDECWLWQAKSRDKDGYGVFSYRLNGKGYTERATRWAWKQLYGSIPADQFVCHTCDNPPCQNPRHWFLGHPQANVDDMVAKGRHKPGLKPGEEHYRAKLTWEVVDEMRRLHASGEWTHQALADRYGVARRTVSHIVNNERWIRE